MEIVSSLKHMCPRNIKIQSVVSRITLTERTQTLKRAQDQSSSFHRGIKFYMQDVKSTNCIHLFRCSCNHFLSRPMVLNGESLQLWRHLETFGYICGCSQLIWRCYWHLVDRTQGRCSTSCDAYLCNKKSSCPRHNRVEFEKSGPGGCDLFF